MSARYLFPFCAISNAGIIKSAIGTITIFGNNSSTTTEFNLMTRTWHSQIADDMVKVDDVRSNVDLEFNISVSVHDPDIVILFFAPTSPDYTQLIPVQQCIEKTDFATQGEWHNLPIKHKQIARVTLKPYATTQTVADIVQEKTFAPKLEYFDLGVDVEDIESYLGKDHLRNLYFNKKIPAASSIPARIDAEEFRYPGDDTVYRYNNLGYRASQDYTAETLTNKKLIICLGDSDTFGIGIEQDMTWPYLVEQQTGATVLNLSVLGISTDGLARIATQTIQLLSPQIVAVFMLYPSMSLREFVSKKFSGGVHTHRNDNLPYADWWEHIDWKSNNYNFNKNKILIESVCAKFSILYQDLYINRDDKKIPLDLIYYNVYSSLGPKTHRAIANYFIKKLK